MRSPKTQAVVILGICLFALLLLLYGFSTHGWFEGL